MGTHDDQPDEPDKTVGRIPTFRTPADPPLALATADWAMDLPPGPDRFNPSPLSGDDVDSLGMDTDPREVPRPDRGTRTATSGTSDGGRPVTAKEVAALAATAIAALAVAASALVRWRTRGQRRLRRPTDDQAGAIGEPLGRILARHIPLPALVPDLRDAILTTVAFTDYLDDGPLTLYQGADPGLPSDLNQEPTL